jgi:hypothetical protein
MATPQTLRVTPLAYGLWTSLLHFAAAIGFITAAIRSHTSGDDRLSTGLFVGAVVIAILARLVKWGGGRELVLDDTGIAIAREGLRFEPTRVERGLTPTPGGDPHDPRVATLAWLRIHGEGAQSIELRAAVRIGAPRPPDWPVAAVETKPEVRVYVALDADLGPIGTALPS